jgi:hypothetical protein
MLREQIAKEIWAYPVLHGFLTLDDAKTYTKWEAQVKFCYEQADSILNLIKAWGEEPCPHSIERKKQLDEPGVFTVMIIKKCECSECWKELKGE